MNEEKKHELVDYVKNQIDAGTDIDTLTGQLKELGWSPEEIEEVFASAGVDVNAEQTPEETGPTPHPPYEETGEGIVTPQMDDASAQEGQSKSSGHKLLATLVVVLLLVGVGVGAAVGITGWSPSMLFSSSLSIQEVIDAHRSVDSFTYDVEFSALTELSSDAENQQQLMSTLMFVPGALENGEVPESVTTELSIGGTASLVESTDAQTNIRLGIGTDEVQDLVDLEYRRVADENYLRGSTLPDLGLINLKPMEDEWLSLGGVTEAAGGAFGASSDLVSATDTDDVSLLEQVSSETRTELRDALQEEGVYTIKSEGGVQLDDGADTYLFSISINPDGIQRYIVRMEEILEDNDPELLNSPMYSELQSFLTDAAEFIDSLNLQDDQIQVWIDQDTYYVRRMQLEMTATEEMLADYESAGVTGGTLTFTLNLSDYNQPIQIDVPTDVKTLQEAQQIIMSAQSSGGMQSAFGNVEVSLSGGSSGTSGSSSSGFGENYASVVESSANDARAESRNLRRQSDLAQIRTALELYRSDNGTYDAGLTPLDSNEEQQEALGEYMDSVPVDPDGSDYDVHTSADGFCVSAPAYEDPDYPDNDSNCSYNYSIGPGI